MYVCVCICVLVKAIHFQVASSKYTKSPLNFRFMYLPRSLDESIVCLNLYLEDHRKSILTSDLNTQQSDRSD